MGRPPAEKPALPEPQPGRFESPSASTAAATSTTRSACWKRCRNRDRPRRGLVWGSSRSIRWLDEYDLTTTNPSPRTIRPPQSSLPSTPLGPRHDPQDRSRSDRLATLGCVPQEKYDDLLTAYRAKERQTLQAQNEVDRMRSNEATLRGQMQTTSQAEQPSFRSAIRIPRSRDCAPNSGTPRDSGQPRSAAAGRTQRKAGPTRSENSNLLAYDEQTDMLQFASDLTFALGWSSSTPRPRRPSALRRTSWTKATAWPSRSASSATPTTSPCGPARSIARMCSFPPSEPSPSATPSSVTACPPAHHGRRLRRVPSDRGEREEDRQRIVGSRSSSSPCRPRSGPRAKRRYPGDRPRHVGLPGPHGLGRLRTAVSPMRK